MNELSIPVYIYPDRRTVPPSAVNPRKLRFGSRTWTGLLEAGTVREPYRLTLRSLAELQRAAVLLAQAGIEAWVPIQAGNEETLVGLTDFVRHQGLI